MAGLDLEDVQEDILDYLRTVFPVYDVDDGAVPEAESIPFVNGIGTPFLVVRFSDALPSSNDTSFGGPIYDGYYSLFDVLCFGPTPKDAKKLASVVNRRILGKKFTNASAISKSYGGGRFVILSDTRQPAAFVATVAFRFNTNIEGVGEGSLVV